MKKLLFVFGFMLINCLFVVQSYADNKKKELVDCGIITNQGGESIIVVEKDLNTTSKNPEEKTIIGTLENGTIARAFLDWDNIEKVYYLQVDIQRPKANGKTVLASRTFNYSTVLPLDYHTILLDFERNDNEELNPSLDDVFEREQNGFTINVSCNKKE